MGCDSQYDGYFDGEHEARRKEQKEIRSKVRRVLSSPVGASDVEVDRFIAAVRAIRDER